MAATKKLVYTAVAMNDRESFRFGEYIFRYSKSLQPIPVLVPSDIAEILLEMQDRSCRCHSSAPQKLFREVE